MDPACACLLVAATLLALALRSADSAEPGSDVPSGATLAIYAGTLIDGTGTDPIRHRVVICRDGRIAAVMDADGFVPESNTCIVDASARTVLPGLIDAEVTLMGDGSGEPPTTRDEWEARYRASAPALLRSGVTTARDVYGGITRVDLPELAIQGLRLRDAIGDRPHPRIIATGPPIGSRDSTYFPLIRISSPQEAADAVSQAVEEGAELIYFFASNIGLSDNPPNLSEEAMKALVAAGHKHGLRVTAESIGLEANRRAVIAGVDCLKHGVYLDDAVIAEMQERGTYYVPTLAIFHHYLESAKGTHHYPGIEAYVRVAEHSLQRALRGGVRVVAGSDSGGQGCPHGTMLQEELELLVAAGMTPAEALRSATGTAAECVGLSDDIGTIGVGKRADLLIVARDPLSDISGLRTVDTVIQGGRIVSRKRE